MYFSRLALFLALTFHAGPDLYLVVLSVLLMPLKALPAVLARIKFITLKPSMYTIYVSFVNRCGVEHLPRSEGESTAAAASFPQPPTSYFNEQRRRVHVLQSQSSAMPTISPVQFAVLCRLQTHAITTQLKNP